MKQQVRLHFDTKEEAIAYCERHGIPYQVFETKPAGAPAHLLFRQFRLRAPRGLDALTRRLRAQAALVVLPIGALAAGGRLLLRGGALAQAAR